MTIMSIIISMSRPPARTRGLKLLHDGWNASVTMSRPPARTRGLKLKTNLILPIGILVASSREDAWIETSFVTSIGIFQLVASSREDAWIETPYLG